MPRYGFVRICTDPPSRRWRYGGQARTYKSVTGYKRRFAVSHIRPQPSVLFIPARCEAVAAERAARMGAILRRESKTAQGRTKHLVRKRPKGEHLSRERVRGSAPASAGARNVRERLPTPIFPCARRQGGAPRGKPPGAAPSGGGAERRRGVERRGVLYKSTSTPPTK